MSCAVIKPDGLKCRSRAMNGKEICSFHSQSKEEHMMIAKKGGEARFKLIKLGEPFKFEEALHVRDFLSDLISGVWTGKIDVRVAGQLSFICREWLEANKQAVIEEKLERFTKMAEERGLTL